MFDALKSFLTDFTGKGPPSRQFESSDYRLAVAALLVHVADADGEIQEIERERVRKLISERFELDPASTAQLIRDALQTEHEEVGVGLFVNVLNRALDGEGRLKIVAMMWDVVYADGDLTETEESIIWRIANMLGVTSLERETLRRSRLPDA